MWAGILVSWLCEIATLRNELPLSTTAGRGMMTRQTARTCEFNIRQTRLFGLLCAAMLLFTSAISTAQDAIGPLAGAAAEPELEILTHMPDELRTRVQKVVIISTQRLAGQDVTGTYEKDTAGLLGGIEAGRRLGRISKQVGPVPIYVPIPILTIPGAIFGGLTGAAQREIQEFRDDLTEELTTSETQPLKDDGLALDVFWNLRKLPQLDSKIYSPTTEISADTQAILHVTFDNVGIDIQGKDAVITTSATAVLRPRRGGTDLFQAVVHYQDRDTLRNWTANDKQLWRSYANYARHYLGREIAAIVFDRVDAEIHLLPLETKSTRRDRKVERQMRSKLLQPVLAWEHAIDADAVLPWSTAVDESNTYYDIEIYDQDRLVYFEEQVPEPSHTVSMELPDCRTYRWSVRPSYHVDGKVFYGDWMRLAPPAAKKSKRRSRKKEAAEDAMPATALGIFGRQASLSPAYTQDFPSLQIDCVK